VRWFERGLASRSAVGLAAAVLILAARPLCAHDFWILPGTFTPEVGVSVPLRLRVGDRLRGEPVLADVKQIERFFAVGPTRDALVGIRQGSEVAGYVRIDAPGLWIVGYRNRPSPISLPAEQFERYLADEGLERIVDARGAHGENGLPGREIFSRCAKSLLEAGPAVEGHDRQLGLRLELIAEDNPYVHGPGDELSFRLLYEGDPLADALVVALSEEDPDARLAARSDSDGRAVFRLGRVGRWLVKAVHMVPAPADVVADWESLWASLTFEIHESRSTRLP
jgi:Domain of unknown function (DUF4198)